MSLPLQDSAARLAAIVASSDDAIVSKDLNGRIMSWNAAAERMFGWTADEVIGKSITIIIPADRQAEEDYVLSQIRQGNVVDHFETVRQRKDGSTLNISVTISPIHAPDGTIVGASKIARDITEQLRLRQSAEEASRLKDEFLATLSHELRTPLNTVLGYATMLEKGMVDEGQRSKAIEVIHRNAQVLSHLVSELLDTSRIVTGKIRLDVARTDLSSLVDEAAENIRPSVAAKGIDFDVLIAPGVQMIGDRERLRQIIWNLLTNAVKFTPTGGAIDLCLSVKRSLAEIVVRDTGIGFAADALPHMFKRFWQADASRIREHSGLGLGLALAKHLTELHGGTIDAISEGEGKGAEFRVTLPLTMEQAAHRASARPALRASGDTST